MTNYWGQWSPNLNWQDVRVGDFNGDGLDDIAGRYLGQWWVARSKGGIVNGTVFVESNWTPARTRLTQWNDPVGAPWRQCSSTTSRRWAEPWHRLWRADSDPDAIFWSQSKDDDEYAAALMSSSV